METNDLLTSIIKVGFNSIKMVKAAVDALIETETAKLKDLLCKIYITTEMNEIGKGSDMELASDKAKLKKIQKLIHDHFGHDHFISEYVERNGKILKPSSE